MIDSSALVDAIVTRETHGVALAGSMARGEATAWSDVDVWRFVFGPTPTAGTRNSSDARWLDGRLVRAVTRTIAEAEEELERPERAVWAVLPTRGMRILFDRDGAVARLKERAEQFRWATVREAAMEWARVRVSKDAENVLKIRAGLEARDDSALINAQGNLALNCTNAVCVGRGVLIPTENRFHQVARDAAGPAWATLHSIAYGVDGGNLRERSSATVALYEATVDTLASVMDDRAYAVARHALEAYRS